MASFQLTPDILARRARTQANIRDRVNANVRARSRTNPFGPNPVRISGNLTPNPNINPIAQQIGGWGSGFHWRDMGLNMPDLPSGTSGPFATGLLGRRARIVRGYNVPGVGSFTNPFLSMPTATPTAYTGAAIGQQLGLTTGTPFARLRGGLPADLFMESMFNVQLDIHALPSAFAFGDRLAKLPQHIQARVPNIVANALRRFYMPVLIPNIPRSVLNKPHLQDSPRIVLTQTGATVIVGGQPNFPYARKINHMYHFMSKTYNQTADIVYRAVGNELSQLVRRFT